MGGSHRVNSVADDTQTRPLRQNRGTPLGERLALPRSPGMADESSSPVNVVLIFDPARFLLSFTDGTHRSNLPLPPGEGRGEGPQRRLPALPADPRRGTPCPPCREDVPGLGVYRRRSRVTDSLYPTPRNLLDSRTIRTRGGRKPETRRSPVGPLPRGDRRRKPRELLGERPIYG